MAYRHVHRCLPTTVVRRKSGLPFIPSDARFVGPVSIAAPESGRTCPASQVQRLLARSVSQPLLATPPRAFNSTRGSRNGITSSSRSSSSSSSSNNSNRSSSSSSGGTEPARSSSSTVAAPSDEPSTDSLQGRPLVHDDKDKLHASVGGVVADAVQQRKGNIGGAAAAAAAAVAGAGGVAGPEEVPLDPAGQPREKQRVDVEFGTFHEFTAVNKNGGKLFEASRELIPVKNAVPFPSMEASCLAGGAEIVFPGRLDGRVTMVGLFHRQFGYSMLSSWMEPFEEAFSAPGVGQTLKITPSAIQVSLLESWALRLLKPVLAHTMGRGLADEEKAAFFYRFGRTDELRKALDIVNRLTLYVLLVDQNGRVRWRGTGKGTPDEIESLIRCARQLAEEGGVGGRG